LLGGVHSNKSFKGEGPHARLAKPPLSLVMHGTSDDYGIGID